MSEQDDDRAMLLVLCDPIDPTTVGREDLAYGVCRGCGREIQWQRQEPESMKVCVPCGEDFKAFEGGRGVLGILPDDES